MATIEQLWVRPASDVPTRPLDRVAVHRGRGVDGDHFTGGGARQITLIDRASWKAACGEIGADLDPALRRANVLVEGVELRNSIGKTLQLGEVRVRVVGETEPCGLMEKTHAGLLRALVPECRGGVYGEILDNGTLSVGDAVNLVDGATSVS